ncbi:MAG: hypothetical protein OXJ52_05310 [Oligoflexia bacterium]|nr:hypothetical protein [Oligoflexia bacterium]
MSNNLSDILRGYVSKEKQKNPYINETGISKKMDIPPTTFNRLVNGHSKPAIKTLLKLSHFIPELKSLLPEELVKVFKVSMEKEKLEYIGKSLETLLSDETIFLCWMLAFLNKGIKADEIKDQFGQEGLKALEILEKQAVIEKDESGFYKVKDKNKYAIFSFELIKAHFLFLAKKYNSKNVASNYIYYEVEALNTEGKKELIETQREFHRKIQKIMNDEKNKGNEPVFSISCSDSLLS